MPDLDPYAPFDRCGWTVQRSQHYLTDEPDMIRVSKGDWSTHLGSADYASFDGDDAAFVGLMEHWHASAGEHDEAVRARIAALPDFEFTFTGRPAQPGDMGPLAPDVAGLVSRAGAEYELIRPELDRSRNRYETPSTPPETEARWVGDPDA